MRAKRLLNTVGKKYVVGYGIVGIFALLFLAISAAGNYYVAQSYSVAIWDLVSANNLETSLSNLNESVNLAYLYLSEAGITEYEVNREKVQIQILETDSQLEEYYIREMADANATVSTYVEKSDELMERLREYLENDRQGNYSELEQSYHQLQEVYSYVTMRFQEAYSVKLGNLNHLEEQLNRLQKEIVRVQLFLLLMAIAGCFFYLYKVIREINGSIDTMMQGVALIQKDVFTAEPIVISSHDEFEEFASAFNGMTEIIRSQMQEIEENAHMKEQLAEMEKENLRMLNALQKSHLDFLQSRINPHFLFNTLNMISSLARIENADQCAELMEITASFLRYNLDNISKTVPLKKELENLKEYVAIQEYRYGGRYTYEFEVDEACMDFLMPCMILQPLVENAIQHGIAIMLEGGKVRIMVSSTENWIFLEVSDNGVGMTEEQIKTIYEDFDHNTSSSSSIGLRNIYQRLKLYYQGNLRFHLYNMEPGLKIVIGLPRKG